MGSFRGSGRKSGGMAEERTSAETLPLDSADPIRRLPKNCGAFEIEIGRDGTWSYRGSPIRRLALVKLFASVLRRETDGSYWLVTPAERGTITVADAPFTAVELSIRGSGRDQVLVFRTNLEEMVEAGEDHPIRVETAPGSGAPRPYLLVRDRLEALIVRSVFYELVEHGREEEIAGTARFGVWSKNRFFALDGKAG
jgi:hypothetical protein